eukprot:m51a1_g11016 putative had-superfamily subfamily variant 3 (142) ;mRNA; r:388253-388900
MEQGNTRALIWDLDGTLVDSIEAHFVSWQEALRAHGRSLTRAQFDSASGKTSRETFDLLFPGSTQDEQAAVLELKESLYRESLRKHFPVMPGAENLIDTLSKAGYVQAIGSSGPPENVQMCANALRNGHLLPGSRLRAGQE